MAPSSLFLKAGAVVMAALTTSVAAVQVPYEKHDVYKGETFFDQWDFFTVGITWPFITSSILI